MVLRLLEHKLKVLTLSNQQVGFVAEFWGIKVLPHRGGRYFENSLKPRYKENHCNLAITLFDLWVLGHIAEGEPINWLPYVPIDGDIDYTTTELLQPITTALHVLAMSKYGQAQLTPFLDKDAITYLPHGVDTAVYHPRSPESRAKTRKRLQFEEDNFVVLTVANNLGDRKDWPKLFETYRIFFDQNPDAKKEVRFFAYTNIDAAEGHSFGIQRLGKKYKIDNYVTVPGYNPRLEPQGEDEMAAIFNTADLFMLLTRGEGFGLPYIESMACGVPCIGTDCTAVTEHLTDKRGWLVPAVDTILPLTTTTHQTYYLADKYKAAEALADAWLHPEDLHKRGKASLAFVKQHHDYDHIVKDLLIPTLDRVAEKIGTRAVDYSSGGLGI